MTEPVPEASDIDIADQSRSADDPDEAAAAEFAATAEADFADLAEQQQVAPLGDDDYR